MTVLAATDFSGMAFVAVRRAAAIARARGARLELLHVIDSFSTAWADAHLAAGSSASTLTIPAEEGLMAVASVVQAEFGLRSDSLVVDGKPAVEIAARSEAVDADLVVLGLRGMSPGLAPLLGTTTRRVLERSRRPVLLVKRMRIDGNRGHPPYRNLVIAGALSPDAAAATECARALFPEATVTLLHTGRARESPADLTVVGSPRVSRRRRLALGGAGMDTIVEAHGDVLVARTPVPAMNVCEYTG